MHKELRALIDGLFGRSAMQKETCMLCTRKYTIKAITLHDLLPELDALPTCP